MKREFDRYIVIKKSDATFALTECEKTCLKEICRRVAASRRARGKRDLKCVVVESDWPEYEPTWDAIEKRVDNVDKEG